MFEIIPNDLKKYASMTHPVLLTPEGEQSAFELWGYLVLFSSDVAQILGVETRQINQNIKQNNKNNPPLFPEKFAFQLTDEETERLRSLGMISKLTLAPISYSSGLIDQRHCNSGSHNPL